MKSGQNCPDREDCVFADRGKYAQFATGIKSSNEKSFNIIWLLINKLNELSENILRKIVKNRKNAQSFVMFDYEDFSEGRAKEGINYFFNIIDMEYSNYSDQMLTGSTTANDETYEMNILKSDLRMISKSTKTKAEKERMKNIFEPIFMDNAMKYFETGLPCCFGDINIDGKDFGVFGLIVWSDDKIVGVEAFVGGMDLDCEIEKLWYDFVHNRFRDMLENYNGVRYYYPANNTDEAMEFASRMVYDNTHKYDC